MSLKPNESLMLAAATLAVVYGTYSLMMPGVADTKALPGNVPDIDSTEKTATAVAAGTVGAVSLLAKSPEVLVIGGLGVIALGWTYKHASKVDTFQQSARTLITPADSHSTSGVTMAGAQTQSQLVTSGSGSAF
jgi:hypothetical protein